MKLCHLGSRSMPMTSREFMAFFMESVLAWEEGPVFQFQMKSESSSFQKKIKQFNEHQIKWTEKAYILKSKAR